MTGDSWTRADEIREGTFTGANAGKITRYITCALQIYRGNPNGQRRIVAAFGARRKATYSTKGIALYRTAGGIACCLPQADMLP